jgi:hypothetical protein
LNRQERQGRQERLGTAKVPRTPRKACLFKNLGVLGVLGGSKK